jgi:hypothetical protein
LKQNCLYPIMPHASTNVANNILYTCRI